MHDLLSEPRISLTDLAKREGVSTATAWRWIRVGIANVPLGSFLVGHRRYTNDRFFRTWVEEITRANNGASPCYRENSRKQHRRRSTRKAVAHA